MEVRKREEEEEGKRKKRKRGMVAKSFGEVLVLIKERTRHQ